MQECRSSSSARISLSEIEQAPERKIDLELFLKGNLMESTNGNIWSCIFLLVSSGIGVHALLLPFSFAILGWAWGIACLLVGYIWPLYTKWLLVQLHEPTSGVRYSRFSQLAFAAFVFSCMAILLALHLNLNSLSWVSVFGTITSLLYCTLLWIVPLVKGRGADVSYNPMYQDSKTPFTRSLSVSFAIEIIGLSFRGHNLSLEIQGTLPSTIKDPSHKTMWKAVKIAYLLIALCTFLIAIAGYWAYGDKVTKQGILHSFRKFHIDDNSTTLFGLVLLLLSLHNLCSYPVHAMLTFGNIEFAYLVAFKKPCSFWLSRVLRLLYGGGTFFVSVALPFMPSLVPIVGGISILPLTFAYPCFMWIAIKKPKPWGPMFLLNFGLGFLGVIMSALFFILGMCKVAREGIVAHLFHP